MCYFTDPVLRKQKMARALTNEEVKLIADAFFHRALKLQIGCGAEPSLYSDNKQIIHLAKQKKVPYISLTTNANRFTENDWRELIEAGLDEATISLHGVEKETYEFFMTNASYDKFISTLQALTRIKKEYPHFVVRINYTVNSDNWKELQSFFTTFGQYSIDVLQVRPINEIGNTEYADFSWSAIIDNYDSTIDLLRNEALARGITFVAPALDDLKKEADGDSSIAESTYFYIDSRHIWQPDFNLNTETFESYSKRTKRAWRLLKKVFSKQKPNATKGQKNLNYRID